MQITRVINAPWKKSSIWHSRHETTTSDTQLSNEHSITRWCAQNDTFEIWIKVELALVLAENLKISVNTKHRNSVEQSIRELPLLKQN